MGSWVKISGKFTVPVLGETVAIQTTNISKWNLIRARAEYVLNGHLTSDKVFKWNQD